MERLERGPNSVAVAICTRNRPEMLRAALRSLARLDLADIDCHFIIVENNDVLTVEPVVAELANAVGSERVVLRLEPRPGIPFARNSALDAALAMDVEGLAFIDDDEVVDAQWLVELVGTMKRDGLDLVGGPVRLQPASADATTSERMVWRGLDARLRDIEAKSRRLATLGQGERITIVTNNWLANLDFVRRAGIRFDETLGLSGGEDTAFYRDLRRAGGKSGWAPEAHVLDTWPRERLTLSYQFRRARDQELAHHHAKYPDRGLAAAIAFLGMALFKTVGGVLRAIQSIFDGGASLVRAARAFGAIAGAADALRGRRSRHYETVSGR